MTDSELLLSLLTATLAALVAAGMTWYLLPILKKVALAKPNARSSHRVPTPQGAGIAVIVAALGAAVVIIAFIDAPALRIPVAVFGSSLFMAAVGFIDDLKPIPVLPRMILQAIAVAIIVVSAPLELRIIPASPVWIERGALLLAGIWFVNLVNFMDGLDWMTVAETVPVTAAIVILGLTGQVPPQVTIVAAGLCGAMLGFAPFNRPVAKIFLGDVGSLPIGLLLGWCLLQLAWHQHLLAALLLPLYYLADTTITLFRRIANREPFWIAHRTHFYQRATDNGFVVLRVISKVFALNLFLATLAIASVRADSVVVDLLAAMAGTAAVSMLLYQFSRKRLTHSEFGRR
jgi:UDP-N-acetylmuramyl pentapeptide phosphotransferase/UDP-N-acetylglucosamine-1-phosphate transferase